MVEKKRLKLEYTPGRRNERCSYGLYFRFFRFLPERKVEQVYLICWNRKTKEKDYRNLDIENTEFI
jgi:hypothetical protein